MNLSYWEHKAWFSNIDFTIVGSGIVGLCCAVQLKYRFPKARILILEKGVMPQGASTKNAGFACFGSISEILHDLDNHTPEEVFGLVEKRWQGIQILRKLLGDDVIGFQKLGGHELFLQKDKALYEHCLSQLEAINQLLRPVFGEFPFVVHQNKFHFERIQPNYITHQFEGQMDTGQMMLTLLKKANQMGVQVLNTISVESFQESGDDVAVLTNRLEFKTNKLLVATNGFASQLLDEGVKPARAQVLITKPIEKLHIGGTFHFDEGYYYFRDIDNRILFGGGRNLDLKAEETTEFGQTELIQMELERLLKEVILPNTFFEIDQRWSGIMGVGNQKEPIIRQISNHVFCGVRLGGMGIAIGSLVGKELAGLV